MLASSVEGLHTALAHRAEQILDSQKGSMTTLIP
jgi:hypothetical protein